MSGAAGGGTDRAALLARIRAALRSVNGDDGDDDEGDTLPGTAFSEVPDAAYQSLAQRLGNLAANNQPIADLFDNAGDEASARAGLALINGLSQGPLAIAQQLAQALSIPQHRAETIARNELVSSYRDAQMANYRANSDVVGQWLWSAAIASACIMCVDMDGTVHSMEEDLIDHVCGRCEPLPITRSWQDIMGSYGLSAAGIPETSITESYGTGKDWFLNQSEATQISIMGPAKFEAWQRGDISLDDLVGVRTDGEWGGALYEKSLKELGLDARDYLPKAPLRGLGPRGSEAVRRSEITHLESSMERIELPGGGYTYVMRDDASQFDLGSGGRNVEGDIEHWQSIDDVMAGLRGETTAATEATGAAAEAEVAEAAAASPFGTVDDILANQDAVEKLYDIPIGDPTTLERDHPEIAERGVAEMVQMIGKLGSELKDNGAFMRLARHFGYSKDDVEGWLSLREGYKRILADGKDYLLEEEDKVAAAMSEQEAKAWAENKSLSRAIADMLEKYHSAAASAVGDITKWNGNNFQVAILDAARQEFGMGKLAHDYYDAEQLAAAREEYGTYRNGIRALLRQMHTDTQQYFEEQGISEVTLFRGLRWNEGDQPAEVAWGGGMTENPITAQPLASWASNAQVAYDYAMGTGMSFFSEEPAAYSMMLATKVPIDQILSIGLTGLGSTPLRETMLLAGDYPVYAIPFQPGEDMSLEAIIQQMAEGAGNE